MTDMDSMTITEAQQDMHRAYLSGAPGMLTSAAVWSAAGAVALWMSPERALWTLFIGAAFIHPVSVLVVKLLGRSGKHAKDNPLASLAFSTTVWLILSCVIAYAVSLYRMEWFFPAMLLVIGGRYLTFATLYGMRLYWVCGLVLALAGYVLVRLGAAPAAAAFTGGALEAGFGIAILVLSRGHAVAYAVKQE
jgi:hypothetical protein